MSRSSRPSLLTHAPLLIALFSLLVACSSPSADPDDDAAQDLGVTSPDLAAIDMASGLDQSRADLADQAVEDLASSLDMERERDLGAADSGEVALDMARDASLDMREEDLGRVDYHTIATFKPLRREIAPFPDIDLVEAGPDQQPSTLYFTGQLRLDPSYSNTNGYPTVDLTIPASPGGCLADATLTGFELLPPETVNAPAMYVMSYFVGDNLRVIVRGSGEITLLMTGTMQFDASTVPQGCLAQEVDVSAPIDFEIALRIETSPVQYSTFVEEMPCPLLGTGAGSSHAMRAGTPILERLRVQHASLDTAWPYPANADPVQQFALSIKGPDTIAPVADARVSEWLVPDTPHPLEIINYFSFDVARMHDPITTIEPTFYLPGFAGSPRALTAGETYTEFGRKSNRILAYIGEMETMAGASLCAAHFPETHHPVVRVEVSSRTPDVCRVQPLSHFTRESLHPFQRLDRWYVGQDEVVIEQDGWCRLDYDFYVDDMATPMLSTPFEVELLNTHTFTGM